MKIYLLLEKLKCQGFSEEKMHGIVKFLKQSNSKITQNLESRCVSYLKTNAVSRRYI